MADGRARVYVIGNAHIDPVWLWRWQEGHAEVLATCRSALDRMNEFPEFVFTRADAATYAWIEDCCPDMFEEIRARVKEGRWSIVGGWWEQPDCNIPGGESFVRHELYGKRYLQEKLGVDVLVGYNVDSFGHNAGLPQILSLAGIRYYVFMRPEPREKDLPDSMFTWEGPDGSRVLVYRLHAPYCTNSVEMREHIDASLATAQAAPGLAAAFFGVGNHGGGPTIASLEAIRSIAADPDAPQPVFGTLEEFFEEAQRARGGEVPVVTGDLQHHAVGCYSAHAGIKKWIRQTESALATAEKLSALASAAALRKPCREQFTGAWKRVLFNQFHDILAGTSLESAYEDARDSLGAARETADYELNTSLAAVALSTDATGDGQPFVVFNPHAAPVKAAVSLRTNSSGLFRFDGAAVPMQPISPPFEDTAARREQVFVDELPALGCRLYYARQEEPAIESSLQATGDALQNSRYRIDLDAQSGRIRQISDRRLGVDLLWAPAGPLAIEDPSDTWSHGVVRFDGETQPFAGGSASLVENGPVRATVRIESRFGGSTMWQDISLYDDLPVVEIRAIVDWREKHRMLKFELPLALSDARVTCEAAYAVVGHPPDGAENPCQRWVDVSGTSGSRECGISLINSAQYGYDFNGRSLRLSILRSPVYAFHDPRKVEPGKLYRYTDQDLHSFTLRLLPHDGRWQAGGTVREALLLNEPPIALETHLHRGTQPGEQSFGSVSVPNVELCALKQAEDGDGLIARLVERSGERTNGTLRLMGVDYPFTTRPFGITTLKLRDGHAIPVDLLEREMS